MSKDYAPSGKVKELFIRSLLFISASASIFFSALIIYTLIKGSWEFFVVNRRVSPISFLTGISWVPNGREPSFGVLPLISGTFLIAGGTILISGPLGVGAAIYLSEFAGSRAQKFLKPVVEILAGIPSIVYGFFALLFISPFLREHLGADYFNALSAIIVMSIMVLPTIVSISDDSLRAVPNHLREASYAMGATKWETITKVVLPAASSGVLSSILLGLARAIGETMVVTLAAGSVANLTLSPLNEVLTMTAYIAQTATGDIPPGAGVEAAFAVGLLLFIITYAVNTVAGRVVLRIKLGKGVHSRSGRVLFRRLRWGGLRVRRAFFDGLKKVRDPSLYLRYRLMKERVGKIAVFSSLLVTVTFLSLLLYYIFSKGAQYLSIDFFKGFPSYIPSKAGIYPALMGSLYLMMLTLIFTVPLGVGAAVYLTEFAGDSKHSRFLRRIIQNLAGVPSIVFGLVGLQIFARTLNMGPSLLAGSLTLSIMVLPIVVVSTEEALKAVPKTFKEAALSLGASRWQSVRDHVLPNALPGILTGSILALSRAIGETAPILFIGAIFSKTPPSGVMDGFTALPLLIFYWTKHPREEFHNLAATTIIVLLGILLLMNTAAIILRNRAQSKKRW